MAKLSRCSVPMIAVLLCGSFAVGQQPQTPAGEAAPAQPRQPRQPQPDKPFELHAITPEFWKLFDKDAKLETMGNDLGGTEGPVWDPAGFLWVSDERGNKIFNDMTMDGNNLTINGAWHDWYVCLILRQEVESLLNITPK